MVTLTWLITGALCGLAGLTFAVNSGTFGATSTDIFLVLILAAVFLGGPGQPYGAMLGALVIGVATEVSASIIVSDYKDVVAFVVLLAMLAVRPERSARVPGLSQGVTGLVYYITTLLVYAGVDAIACLGLSQQFGVAGVTNFGFIIFQAAGAYTAAVLSLPLVERQRRFSALHRRPPPALPAAVDRGGDRRRCARRALRGDRRPAAAR